MTPESVTAAYRRHGLPATMPATMPAEQRQAWADYQAGKGAPMRLLPMNGGTCYAESMGGPYCGRPLFVDGTCSGGGADHRDVVETQLAEFAAEHNEIDITWRSDDDGGDIDYRTCKCGHRWREDIPYCPEGPEPDEDD